MNTYVICRELISLPLSLFSLIPSPSFLSSLPHFSVSPSSLFSPSSLLSPSFPLFFTLRPPPSLPLSAFGLWLDGDLDNGSTRTCKAFNNTPLSSHGTNFRCANVEVYSCE